MNVSSDWLIGAQVQKKTHGLGSCDQSPHGEDDEELNSCRAKINIYTDKTTAVCHVSLCNVQP